MIIDYQKYISALRKCAKEHENDRTSFGHIIVSDMCRDTANFLESLEQNIERKEVTELKEVYNKGYKDGQEALAFHLELCKEEGSIITVPEGATNGEVFEKLMREAYPKALMIYGRNDDTKTIAPILSEDWWNSPYRKEQE